jgi:hypothetical protein
MGFDATAGPWVYGQARIEAEMDIRNAGGGMETNWFRAEPKPAGEEDVLGVVALVLDVPPPCRRCWLCGAAPALSRFVAIRFDNLALLPG